MSLDLVKGGDKNGGGVHRVIFLLDYQSNDRTMRIFVFVYARISRQVNRHCNFQLPFRRLNINSSRPVGVPFGERGILEIAPILFLLCYMMWGSGYKTVCTY